MASNKLTIYIFLGFTSAIVIFWMLNFPYEGETWIPGDTPPPLAYLFGTAYLIAACYLFIIVKWNEDPNISIQGLVLSFLVCGTISIILTIPIYEIFNTIFLHEVETGWWIFKKEETVFRNGVFEWLSQTNADAGLVEEPSKFLSLLVIPRVRRSITNVQSGIFYSALCAFGFAMIENSLYFCTYSEIIWLRANPLHAVFSSLWGAAYGKWKAGEGHLYGFLAYMTCGMALHALFNVGCSLSEFSFLIIYGATICYGLSFIRRSLRTAR